MTYVPTRQELEQLLGQREDLLSRIKCQRLAHPGMRLVLFRGKPLGIIERHGMNWCNVSRWFPPYSGMADAGISVVGWSWAVFNEGGPEALRKHVARVVAQAEAFGYLQEEAPC